MINTQFISHFQGMEKKKIPEQDIKREKEFSPESSLLQIQAMPDIR